uniref:Small nuclear ribonucleoprotein Sm D2 n=1 Tax=Mus spicilegus TaxID=10103 RepID=A0A8C6I0R3_MUSSI
MSLLNKPKSEMTPEELQKPEEEEFNTGPLSVLSQSVKNNTQVLINCRNKKKLLGRVKAFDTCNMVCYNQIMLLCPFCNPAYLCVESPGTPYSWTIKAFISSMSRADLFEPLL